MEKDGKFEFELFSICQINKWLKGLLKSQCRHDFTCPNFINPFNFSTIQPFNRKRFVIAFTMAEILISLTIIGIIAAITLPSLQANINEKTWATQRKALYNRLSQAVSLMGNVNSYGIGATQAQTNENAALVFVTDGLSKVLKINNICDSEHLKDCGIPATYKKFKSNTAKVTFPKTLHEFNSYLSVASYPLKHINTNVAAFETANGESVAVFYNPQCAAKDIEFKYTGIDRTHIYVWPYFCLNFVYDLNGTRGPNTFGKDIWFISTLYSDKLETIMFNPESISKSIGYVVNYNAAKSSCAAIDARIPTFEEGIVSIYNVYLSGFSFNYFRDILSDKPYSWYTSVIFEHNSGVSGLRCIYRNKK